MQENLKQPNEVTQAQKYLMLLKTTLRIQNRPLSEEEMLKAEQAAEIIAEYNRQQQ